MHSRDVFEGLFMLHLTTARMSLISLGALVGYECLEYHVFAKGGEGGLSET